MIAARTICHLSSHWACSAPETPSTRVCWSANSGNCYQRVIAMLAIPARLLINQLLSGLAACGSPSIRCAHDSGELSICPPQLCMSSVSSTAAVLALGGCFGTLVCSLEFTRSIPAGSGYGRLVWGSSCFDWTSTSARPQHRVFCALAAPVNLYGDETTVGVRSLARRIARLYTSPAVFCCLFSEAGLAGQYRGSL